MSKKFDLGPLRRILRYVKPYWGLGLGSVLITITFALLVPIRPYVTQYLFDHCIAHSDAVGLIHWTILLVVLLVLEAIFQFLDGYFSSKLGQLIINDLRDDVFKKNLNFHLGFFDKMPVGTLITRVVSDIETIGDVFSDGLIVIIGDLLKLSIIFTVMLHTNWKLSLVCLTTIPILILITIWFKNAIKKTFQDVRQQVARLNTFLQERIGGLQIVQLFNREQQEVAKFDAINRDHRDANIRSVWYYSVFFPIVEILSSISLGLLVWYGGLNAFLGKVSLGEIIAFVMYITMLFRPIRMLADRFNTLQMGIVSSERVFKLLDTPIEIEDNGQMGADQFMLPIEFRNVSFHYGAKEENNWALKDLSLTIQKGELIALVGETGSGKTTIVNLINRFYEYQAGEILVNGNSLRDYQQVAIRKNIAMVMQDVFLFSDTIANNISMLDPSITREKTIEAAKEIGVHEFILSLPNNYDFVVKERGADLSVGQRQLIAFIRASVFNPTILILDEATSSIDTETEMFIKRATEKLIAHRTSIVIAHRLSTIQKANKILVLENGRVIEQGTHAELLQKEGRYKVLTDLQKRKME